MSVVREKRQAHVDLRIMRELMPVGMEKQMLMSTATSSGMRCVSVYCVFV